MPELPMLRSWTKHCRTLARSARLSAIQNSRCVVAKLVSVQNKKSYRSMFTNKLQRQGGTCSVQVSISRVWLQALYRKLVEPIHATDIPLRHFCIVKMSSLTIGHVFGFRLNFRFSATQLVEAGWIGEALETSDGPKVRMNSFENETQRSIESTHRSQRFWRKICVFWHQ